MSNTQEELSGYTGQANAFLNNAQIALGHGDADIALAYAQMATASAILANVVIQNDTNIVFNELTRVGADGKSAGSFVVEIIE